MHPQHVPLPLSSHQMFFAERCEDLVIIGSTVTANLPVLQHWWSAAPEQASAHSKHPDTRPFGLADALYESVRSQPNPASHFVQRGCANQHVQRSDAATE